MAYEVEKEAIRKRLQEASVVTEEDTIRVVALLFKENLKDEKFKIPFKELKTLGFSNEVVDRISARIWFTEEELGFIANMEDDYVKAITIVGRIYAERMDSSGNPQSIHLSVVSEALKTYEGKVAGLLHDVVEDNYLTLGSLRYIFQFNEKSVCIVDVLTRDKDIYPTYDSYIKERILPSEILEVQKLKLADMEHNQSPERVKDLPTEERRHKASTKYKPYIPLVKARAEELEEQEIIKRRLRK